MSKRIKDLQVGELLICSRHNGPVTLTPSMKKEQRRICDECISTYKKAFMSKDRERKRHEKHEAGFALNTQSLDGEVWRDIPEYDGYQASNYGRIRSLDRKDSLGRLTFGRILAAYKNPLGYYGVRIKKMGGASHKTTPAHLLVLMAFVGPRPSGHVCAHNDGNPSNNAITNLRYATPKENEADKLLHGTRFYARGESNGHAKLTEQDVREIVSQLESGATQAALAKRYGVESSNISGIWTRRRWQHVWRTV